MSAKGFDKWAVLDSINWDPHPGQLLIAESTARHRVASCGRRFGKSDLGGHELVPEALFTYTRRHILKETMKRREFWIVGPQYSDSEKEFRVVWNELSKLEVPFDKPGSYNDPTGGSMHLSCFDGAFQVHAKSAQHPETLVGEGLSGVIMAEAAKMKPSVWVKSIRATLSDFNGWSLHTSTPEGRNHFYDLYKLGKDPGVPEWASWRMPAWVNPYVYKSPTKKMHVKQLQKLMEDELRNLTLEDDNLTEQEAIQAALQEAAVGRLKSLCIKHGLDVDSEILDLMSSTSTEAFNQEIGAEFTSFVGRVFKDFDEEVHVGDLKFNPKWQTYACADYGYRNPNVWLVIQVGPWGEINVIRELYIHEHTPQEFADEIVSLNLHHRVQAFYPDPASPADSDIISDTINVPWRGGTGGDLKPRLDAIRRALKEVNTHVPFGHPDRRPTLMIDRSCSMTIYEMNEYRYPDKKELNSVPGQENPQKKDDHTPEALGRFFAGHFKTPQEEAGPGRSSKAAFKRRR